MTIEQRNRILAALWSLKEDSNYAWKTLLAGDDSSIKIVGDSYKNLEKLIIELDSEKRDVNHT